MPTAPLLERLFAVTVSDPQLAPGVQWQVFRYGTFHRCYDLVAALAANPNLDPEVDAAIAEVSNSVVTAAWMARPGRSYAEVASRYGKRITIAVRIELAGRNDLPPEDYVRVLEPPNEKVAEAVLRNHASPLFAQQTAASQLAVFWASRSVAVQNQRFNEFLAGHEELHDAAAITVGAASFAALLCQSALEPKTVDRLLDEVLLPALQPFASGKYGDRTTSALQALSFLAGTGQIPTDRHESLKALLTVVAPAASGQYGGTYSSSVDNVLKLLANADRYLVVQNSTDLDQLHRLADQLTAQPDRFLARALACHPLSDLYIVQRAYGVLQNTRLSTDLAAIRGAHRADIDILAFLIASDYSHIPLEEIELSPDPESLLVAIMLGYHNRPDRTWVPTYMADSPHFTKSVTTQLPLATVVQLADANEKVRGHVAELLDEELGDNPELWNVLGSLVDLDQPFGMLLSSIALLCSVESAESE